jgi:hypothetical protein
MTLLDISKEIDKLEMSENNSELPISSHQKQELDQRYIYYQTGKEVLEDW